MRNEQPVQGAAPGDTYRPQHFIGHEMPITAARMMIFGQTRGAAITKTADVLAEAKCPLVPGDVLDGEGGLPYMA